MDFIIVGLGNPGREYENSRHNVGFKVIDILCERLGVTLSKETPSCLGSTIRIGNKKILLTKPTTFMNESGIAVGELVRRYKIEPSQLIIIHDELDLEFGVVKMKLGGGLAGHNGLRSIKSHIKTDEFIRVRIGVGKPSHKSNGANHVLSPMNKKEKESMEISYNIAADAVELIVNVSLDVAMQQIHSI